MFQNRQSVGFAVFLLSFFVFLLTVCPSVFVGDSGELSAAALTLGIPHPPGYPVYCLSGRIFGCLPAGSPAFRLNIMSVFFAAAACFVLFFLCLYLLQQISVQQPSGMGNTSVNFISAFTALTFAFSPGFWSQALSAEVYTLNIFFIVLILYLLVMWYESGKQGVLYLLSFTYGLGSTHHPTMIFLLPLFVAFIAWEYIRLKTLTPKNIAAVSGLFISGLLFYAYIPVRAACHPQMNWGGVESFNDVISHIFRRQYGMPVSGPRTFTDLTGQIGFYFSYLVRQFPVLVWPLVLTGLSRIKGRAGLFLIFFFLMASAGIVLSINFPLNAEGRYTTAVFFIPSGLIVCIWLAAGLEYLLNRTKKWIKLPVIVLAMVLPVIQVALNFKSANACGNYVALDYGRNLVGNLPEHSVLFTAGDNEVFLLAYLQKIEKYRHDIEIYDDLGFVFPGIYERDYLKLSYDEAEKKRREIQRRTVNSGRMVFCTIGSSMYKQGGLYYLPYGVVFRVLNKMPDKKSDVDTPWNNIAVRTDTEQEDFYCRSIVANYHFFLGQKHAFEGEKNLALDEYKKAGTMAEDMPWIQNNLGIAYADMGEADMSVVSARMSSKESPREPVVHKNMASLYLDRRLYQEAVSEAEFALKLRPGWQEAKKIVVEACTDFAKQQMLNKNIGAAADALQKAVELDPTVINYANDMSADCIQKKQYEPAIYLCEKIIQWKPDFANAYNNLGIAFGQTGQTDKAVAAFKKSLALKPDDADICFNLGLLYRHKGDKAKAVHYWQQALKIDPVHRLGRQNLESLENEK